MTPGITACEGADGPAYHAIVGSGPNALALHYSASARVMNAAEMLLIDYAPELDHYTTDITRTWPVDGKFTERAALLYDAVLAAQEAGIATAKPGVKLREVDAACWKVLEARGFPAKTWKRHGCCHFIGMEVHDPGLYAEPVVPGGSGAMPASSPLDGTPGVTYGSTDTRNWWPERNWTPFSVSP